MDSLTQLAMVCSLGLAGASPLRQACARPSPTYRGVFRKQDTFAAGIVVRGVVVACSRARFETPLEAAAHYDELARTRYGEFAVTNAFMATLPPAEARALPTDEDIETLCRRLQHALPDTTWLESPAPQAPKTLPGWFMDDDDFEAHANKRPDMSLGPLEWRKARRRLLDGEPAQPEPDIFVSVPPQEEEDEDSSDSSFSEDESDDEDDSEFSEEEEEEEPPARKRKRAAPAPPKKAQKYLPVLKTPSKGTRKPHASSYLGVTKATKTSRWQVRIRSHGKPIALGCYVLEEDAARAYDEAARELHHPPKCKLNFPTKADFLAGRTQAPFKKQC